MRRWWEVRKGLSPRVRGSPLDVTQVQEGSRSIPACAGEPFRRWQTMSTLTVYPRVCGGAEVVTTMHDLAKGLSPRVRGEPRVRAGRIR